MRITSVYSGEKLKMMQDVNNIGKVYRHNNRVVYHSIVVYTEDSYHAYS